MDVEAGKRAAFRTYRKSLGRKGEYRDVTGQKFGRLLVLSMERQDGELVCNVVCDCGTTKTVLSYNIANGSTNSCGCLFKEKQLNYCPDCLGDNSDLPEKRKSNRCNFCYWLRARLGQYGLSRDEYIRMVRQQDGLCFICEVRPAVCIDHIHPDGPVRALLCQECNKGLGCFGDRVESIRSAAGYVSQFAFQCQ